MRVWVPEGAKLDKLQSTINAQINAATDARSLYILAESCSSHIAALERHLGISTLPQEWIEAWGVERAVWVALRQEAQNKRERIIAGRA